jgi:WD40 repeat protein
LWNVSTGQLIRTFKDAHSDTLTGIRFSPNGQFLATSSTDRFMKVFKVKDGSFVRSFEGHTHHVTDVAWNPDGHQLASAGADQIIKIWDFKTGEQKKTIQGYRKQVTSLHYVGLTDQLFTTSGSPGIRLGEDTFKGGPDFTTDSAINRDGQVAVTGGIDGVLRVWNVPEKTLRIEFKVPSSKNLTASRPQ